MSKQINFGDEARNKIFAGMEKVAATVIITMGPKGRNVILDKGYGTPLITNDGVTIAKEIELEDKFENMGAQLVIEAAEKTNSIAGDGTTTATLLTYAIAKEGLKNIQTGVNPVELKSGMKIAASLVVDELDKNAKQITSKEEIAQVATISAQDEIVGKIIAEAMDKVGNDGVISVEEGQTFGLEVETTSGMEFEQGYISPYMITNAEKMNSEIKDALILITDQKISRVKDLLPILEQVLQSGRKELVIIADDLESEALTAIVLNKLKGILNVLAVKSPGFGDKKRENLKDLAILTGANLISSELAMKLENVTLEDLGRAGSVISTKDKTTIIGGHGEYEEIEKRVAMLKNEIATTNSTYDKEKIIQRLAKLAGGVAVIKVGAASEVEMKEKKLRIEDALNATKAAVEEGIVAGGGVALLKASKILDNIELANKDQNIGAQIVKQALSYPVKQILENAGRKSELIVEEIEKNPNVNYGYDAATDEFVDMINAGIIDPKKVERVALQEAVSLAGMFLTTEAAICDLPGKKDDVNPYAGMGGMGGMPMM